MTLAAKALVLRRAARGAIWAGDFARAGELARKAQEICPTAPGRKLDLLARWLAATRSRGGTVPAAPAGS